MDIQYLANNKPDDHKRVFRGLVKEHLDEIVSAARNGWRGQEIVEAIADPAWFPNEDEVRGAEKTKRTRANQALRDELHKVLSDVYSEMQREQMASSPNEIRRRRNLRLASEYAELCKAAGEYAGTIPAPEIDYGETDAWAG